LAGASWEPPSSLLIADQLAPVKRQISTTFHVTPLLTAHRAARMRVDAQSTVSGGWIARLQGCRKCDQAV
jgi:hypothetical protein